MMSALAPAVKQLAGPAEELDENTGFGAKDVISVQELDIGFKNLRNKNKKNSTDRTNRSQYMKFLRINFQMTICRVSSKRRVLNNYLLCLNPL